MIDDPDSPPDLGDLEQQFIDVVSDLTKDQRDQLLRTLQRLGRMPHEYQDTLSLEQIQAMYENDTDIPLH